MSTSGDALNRSNVVGAIYGYAVCLIAVLLVIANSAGFVSNAFRIADPGIGATPRGDVFFRTRGPGPGFGDFPPGPPAVLSVQRPIDLGPAASGSPGPKGAMRTQRFEEIRGEMVAQGRINAVRGLVVNIVLLVIAALLFRAHWRWLGNTRLRA